MAESFHTIADQQTLERVISIALEDKSAPHTAKGSLDPAFENLLSQVVRYATGEDKYWNEPESLLARVMDAWSAAKARTPGEPTVSLRLYKSENWRDSRLVLDVIADDMPFIVDSVTAALTDAGKTAHFFANAVINVARDEHGKRTENGKGAEIAESIIHAELDPPVDDGEIEILELELHAVLADTALAVADFGPMRDRLASGINQLERYHPRSLDDGDLNESIEFLKKLWDNKFTFLGVRRYNYALEDGEPHFSRDLGSDLGILRDNARRVLKTTWSIEGELSPAVIEFMQSNEPLIITKANARSTVHRRVHMDYVGLKIYGEDGSVIGEDRFVGLLTSDMYNRPASDIPILRKKIRNVIEGAGFRPGGHNAKALVHILETFPRDEMFQSDIETLTETALGILRLYKRPRTKVFLRRDRFDRFISALVYIPRDRFSSNVREGIGDIMADAYDGYIAAFSTQFGDASLVRVHYIIGIAPGAPEGPGITELVRRIREVTRTWGDNLLDALREANEGATPHGLFQRYESAFDVGYRERTATSETLDDIAVIEGMSNAEVAIRVFRRPSSKDNELNIKLYCPGHGLRLSDLIPQLENLGLSVLLESDAQVQFSDHDGAGLIWIHDFYTEEKRGRTIDVSAIKHTVETAFSAILGKRAEDDGFNALVVLAGLDWREVAVLRAGAKYLLQSGFSYSQSYIEETLSFYPEISRNLVNCFHAKFNPSGSADLRGRADEIKAIEAKIIAQLEDVQSLDQDRIIRRFLNLLSATVRTNYYQRTADGAPKPYISLKLNSSLINDLPEPKPFREIFVSGPRVDGVHLRFGAIARGGLRWSDRKEDFRTEVLGLVKAQRVKNAVIVPSGSKGGFFPKQLPMGGDRNEIFEEGKAAYRDFIRGMLDVTDNIVSGETVSPESVVRWDEDDPYLVVAADKGTATFSDTANAISSEYKFWLGDAFASGGSAGYDHKAMGITARGAWEAVKRHFRELGKDIQREPFTVSGVGDMSGDVFGNGMLLSEQIRLVAAFDHRDIFIDPDPDPATSYSERCRLFEMSRSSWQDYDKSKMSIGGGIFPRTAKSINLSPEIKALLGFRVETATPSELIQAILKAPVELFWLGGIGTYFKAAHEDNSRVGDRANDAIRINADEMRMKVIGEGANLGLTQAARIQFARAGGSINTDAIDNSAGVDSSDHEVNIKILLSSAIEHGSLKENDRNALLKEMTEDVASHVLQHNYDQTRAITLMSADAATNTNTYARYMGALEAAGRLDRELEGLPSDKELAVRKAQNEGLTRPELSVLLAYAKMQVFEELIDSTAPDDPMLERELFGYFPEQTHNFKHAIIQHRLRREIIGTRLANEIVDTCGATFVHNLTELSGASIADVSIAYESARRILNLGQFGADVDALDNSVKASLQTDLYNTAVNLLAEQVSKIISDVDASTILIKSGIKGLIQEYRDPIQALKVSLPDVLPPSAAKGLKSRAASWRKRGAPDEIADEAALMASLEFAFDIVNLSRETGWSAEAIAAVFFATGHRFHIDAARNGAKTFLPDSHFERLAARRLVDELSTRQSAIARSIASFAGDEPNGQAKSWLEGLISGWRKQNSLAVERYERFATELDIGASASVGKLSLMNQKLLELVLRAGA